MSKGQGKAGKVGKGRSGGPVANNKDYEHELNGSSETLRHLQRIHVTSLVTGAEVPSLMELPVQLGFCSARDFHQLDDDCKRGFKKRQPPDFLNFCCDVGLLT